MQRMVQWESFAELKTFKLLDCDPEVKSFSEQPFTIHYRLGGRWRHHYPDILVERGNSTEVWEVKTERDAQHPDFEGRTAFLQREMPNLGLLYRVIDRTDFDAPGKLAHAETLLRYGRSNITLFDRELVRRLLEERGVVNWRAAKAGEYGPRGCRILCRLVLEGKLQARSALLPSPETELDFCEESN